MIIYIQQKKIHQNFKIKKVLMDPASNKAVTKV